jgi:hypothetical protein
MMWDHLRETTADPAALAAACAAARLSARQAVAVARGAGHLLDAVGGAGRYEALRAFLAGVIAVERGRARAAQRPDSLS